MAFIEILPVPGEPPIKAGGRDITGPFWAFWRLPVQSLGVDQIVMMTGLSRQIARDSLRELDQFLDPLLRLKGEYQLYHQSIIDFLADKFRALG